MRARSIFLTVIAWSAMAQTPRVTWRMRTLMGDQRVLNWKVGLPSGSGTLFEEAEKADRAGMGICRAPGRKR